MLQGPGTLWNSCECNFSEHYFIAASLSDRKRSWWYKGDSAFRGEIKEQLASLRSSLWKTRVTLMFSSEQRGSKIQNFTSHRDPSLCHAMGSREWTMAKSYLPWPAIRHSVPLFQSLLLMGFEGAGEIRFLFIDNHFAFLWHPWGSPVSSPRQLLFCELFWEPISLPFLWPVVLHVWSLNDQ